MLSGRWALDAQQLQPISHVEGSDYWVFLASVLRSAWAALWPYEVGVISGCMCTPFNVATQRNGKFTDLPHYCGHGIHAMLPGCPALSPPGKSVQSDVRFVCSYHERYTHHHHHQWTHTFTATCRTRCTSVCTHGSLLKRWTQTVNSKFCQQIESMIGSSRFQLIALLLLSINLFASL